MSAITAARPATAHADLGTGRPATAHVEFAAGRPVVLLDPPTGEGHLVLAAEHATTAAIAFLVRHTSGFVEVALGAADCARLHLPPMWSLPGAPGGARDHTITLDAVDGVSTGISAADRARTIRAMADPGTKPADFTRPGHVAPVRATGTGAVADLVLELAAAAGTRPLAAFAALVAPRHSARMADVGECHAFAAQHGLAVVAPRG
ncbi:3,4-dihydroxy-2-butanone-4-phosphate synthase [Nocardia sp. NPDC057353]|uniref:3,4-dihydroxy-2-butanone-4-phosphate synthase n=1 Tax=Nocardia sp. NPDC057353 TaxID=3346104 RepID=UPI0036274696